MLYENVRKIVGCEVKGMEALGIIAQPNTNPTDDALDDQIAELVAEALYEHMVKDGMVSRSKQDIMANHAEETHPTDDGLGSGDLPALESVYRISHGGTWGNSCFQSDRSVAFQDG